MRRLNRVTVETLSATGRIDVEAATQVNIATDGEQPVPLDLSWKAARVLIERAAEASERIAAAPC
jgi:hypothetical protein